MTERKREIQGLLTINDLCWYLQVSRGTVYHYVNKGELKTVRVGERIRFRIEDVDEWIQTNRAARPTPPHYTMPTAGLFARDSSDDLR